MKKSINQTYLEHKGKVTDKWSLYLTEWDHIFEPYRKKPIHLLEIGIQNGGSLEIWAKIFPGSEKIVGCDIDKKCELLKFKSDRIAVVVGDANSDDCERAILKESNKFDIIIDDGSHCSKDVVRTFARYFPALNDDGIFLIEDLHTSYWDNFEGGLYNPLTSIAFFKRLTDLINFEHWRNNRSRLYHLKEFAARFEINFDESELLRIHSIEFINSLCIIKKLPPSQNTLGKRIIVGSTEVVSKGQKKLNDTIIQDLQEYVKDDSALDVFELMAKIDSLYQIKSECEQSIQNLSNQVGEKDQLIQTLLTQVAEKENTVQSLATQIQENQANFQTQMSQLAEKEKTIQLLTAVALERQQINQALTAKVAEREQINQALTTQVAEREKSVQLLSGKVAEREKSIQELTGKLAESEREILMYALSRSWRMTRPFRKLMSGLKKRGNL